VASSRLEVHASCPVWTRRLRDAAAAAKDGCPVSQALRGNVEISVAATLDQGS